jgi:hypothetical protein
VAGSNGFNSPGNFLSQAFPSFYPEPEEARTFYAIRASHQQEQGREAACKPIFSLQAADNCYSITLGGINHEGKKKPAVKFA